jgi:hypothetical protein
MHLKTLFVMANLCNPAVWTYSGIRPTLQHHIIHTKCGSIFSATSIFSYRLASRNVMNEKHIKTRWKRNNPKCYKIRHTVASSFTNLSLIFFNKISEKSVTLLCLSTLIPQKQAQLTLLLITRSLPGVHQRPCSFDVHHSSERKFLSNTNTIKKYQETIVKNSQVLFHNGSLLHSKFNTQPLITVHNSSRILTHV